MRHIILYHWTHHRNVRSIARFGLDPAWCEGRLRAIWACQESRVGWALGHVAYRHGWEADDMVLLRIKVPEEDQRRTAYRGVKIVRDVIPPEHILGH